MAQVSLTDIVSIVRVVEHYKGKYVKALLTTLEEEGVLTPPIRKAVLDSFNTFSRSILRRLGYVIES